MSWSVSYDKDRHLVEMIFKGYVSVSDSEQSKVKAIRLSLEHECYDFLVDSSEKTQLESIAHLYQDADHGFAEEGLSRASRCAIVLPKVPEAREKSKFFEIVCRNRGWMVQTFEDRESALRWLKSDQPDINQGANDDQYFTNPDGKDSGS